MKYSVLAITTTLVAIGCSGSGTGPSEKFPDAGAGNVEGSAAERVPRGEGLLRVDLRPESRGAYVESPLSYRVYDDHGRLVADHVPGEITLRAGRYLIEVPSTERSPDKFWVSIAPGRVTEVDPAGLMEAR